MAVIDPRSQLSVDLPMPKFDEIDPKLLELEFDKKADTLYIQHGVPRPGISVDLDGEFWMRMDPTTGEILGFEIEDFERVFLPKHPEIASAWREAMGPRRGPSSAERGSLLTILLNLIGHFLGQHPQQLRLCGQL